MFFFYPWRDDDWLETVEHRFDGYWRIHAAEVHDGIRNSGRPIIERFHDQCETCETFNFDIVLSGAVTAISLRVKVMFFFLWNIPKIRVMNGELRRIKSLPYIPKGRRGKRDQKMKFVGY